MKTFLVPLPVIALVGASFLMTFRIPAYGEGQSRTLMMSASYHRTQAAAYRQEAVQLGQAIQRYEIMVRVYQNGSERAVGTVNPQGRRVMVKRTQRVIVYFQQKQQEIEQRVADHEALAQSLPES